MKQARERTLGIRALIRGGGGTRQAITSTSDLSEAAVDRLAQETDKRVALVQTTASIA